MISKWYNLQILKNLNLKMNYYWFQGNAIEEKNPQKVKFSRKKSGPSENSSDCRRSGRNSRRKTSNCWSNRRWNSMSRSSINKAGSCWVGNTTTIHASTAPPSNRTMMPSISSIPKPPPGGCCGWGEFLNWKGYSKKVQLIPLV